MRKKNEVTLYNGGLIVLGVLILIFVAQFVAQQKQEIKSKYEQIVENEKVAVSSYTDKELVQKYYEISAEIKSYEELLEKRKSVYIQSFGSSYFAQSGEGGGLKDYEIKKKLEALRKIRALYLSEIYERELKPVE